MAHGGPDETDAVVVLVYPLLRASSALLRDLLDAPTALAACCVRSYELRYQEYLEHPDWQVNLARWRLRTGTCCLAEASRRRAGAVALLRVTTTRRNSHNDALKPRYRKSNRVWCLCV